MNGARAPTAEQSERRFFMTMAAIMVFITIAGFAVNLGMGRSTFAVPAIYHVHAIIFMGWLALFLAQAVTIATGRRELHSRLGKLGYICIPLMVVAGTIMTVAVARRTDGPIGFAISEAVIAGTPGAERPMAAFLPPGFAM